MKNIYFLSDAHLGSKAIEDKKEKEKLLVQFLDSIKHKAKAIYLLGDMFDFWYEFKTVVPKGFTRFLGKLSELTDLGIEIHFFIGNHDIWCNDYLENECGVIMHYEPEVIKINSHNFFLAHGDGLGDPDIKFQYLRKIFHNKTLQQLFSTIHPRWSVSLGLNWAKKSREKRVNGKDPEYMGEEKEHLVLFAKEHSKNNPINFYIFGHRHIMLDLMIKRDTRVILLGDWINYYSYAVFDGNNLILDQYIYD